MRIQPGNECRRWSGNVFMDGYSRASTKFGRPSRRRRTLIGFHCPRATCVVAGMGGSSIKVLFPDPKETFCSAVAGTVLVHRKTNKYHVH